MQTRDLYAMKRAKGRFALSTTKYAFKSEKRSKSLKLQTEPAATEKDFSPAKNIVGCHLNFQPETNWTAADRTCKKPFIQGVEVKMIAEKEDAKKRPKQ